MTDIYFRIGEEVQLVSAQFPEASGTYFVEDIQLGMDDFICPEYGTIIIPREGVSYKLAGLASKRPNGKIVSWATQRSLRKVDKGAGSWEDVMESLKEEQYV